VTTTVTLSLADYLARPEEHNTEWSQGALIVNPAPTVGHQVAAATLMGILHDACPSDCLVVHGVGWLLAPEGPYRVPDIVVIKRSQGHGPHLTSPPVLAVEFLSPGQSPEPKLTEYAAAGLAHHWTLDVTTSTLTVYELIDGNLDATLATGGAVRIERPFPVELDPASLFPQP
jgi:Uma2 family endonuclease